MKVNKKRIIWVILIFILLILIILISTKNNSKKTGFFTIEDKTILPEEKCSKIEEYVIIYETGCPFCAKVLPRIEEIEKEFNISFKHYNLALEKDFKELKELGIMPVGVPCVIINCKAYIGAGYSIEDFRSFILQRP